MIKIMGDIHGELEKVYREINKEIIHLKNGDNLYVILLGDAGVNFYLSSVDEKMKRGLQKFINYCQEDYGVRVIVLFVRGNHDCPPKYIYSYKLTSFCGGKAYWEDKYPSLFFLDDGELYKVEGHDFFVIGGANSKDYFRRLLNAEPFFPDEGLSIEEQDKIIDNLSEVKECDLIILSHMLPEKASPEVSKYEIAGLSVEYFLQKIFENYRERISYWLAGHYHMDISYKIQDTCFTILFNNVLTM